MAFGLMWWVGVARALSPDARFAHPGLRSLGAGLRFGILPPLASYAGSQATGNPFLGVDWGRGASLASNAGSQGTGNPSLAS